MADVVDKATRSRMMSGVRTQNTKPELLLRSRLHAKGFRYRLHVRTLPGRPDLVLSRLQAVVFVHGCFWHRHRNCRWSNLPKTNTDFWKNKLAKNTIRDRRTIAQLISMGWRVAEIWECSLKPERIEFTTMRLGNWLQTSSRRFQTRVWRRSVTKK